VTVLRGGSINTFTTLNIFFLISQTIISGSNYWNMGIDLDKGDLEKDAEGIENMKLLGQNMA